MRSIVSWVAARNGVLFAALLLFGASLAVAKAPPIFVPADDGVVLARVPKAYEGWRQGDRATASPDELNFAMAQVARSGDARLAGRLQKQLEALPSDSRESHIVLARAWLAQHQHQFDHSRRLLDILLARDTVNANALAMRAHLNLTQGRLRDAQKDCAALIFVEPRQATLCAGRLAARRGNWAAAERVLSRLHTGDDPVARDARLLSAEIASAQGNPGAEKLFIGARSAAPADWRPLLAHARWLRRNNRAGEALAILPEDTTHDGLSLERVLAAADMKSPEAERLRERLHARQAAARAAGAPAETRDEAEIALLAGDSARALELAMLNFATQRDIEDVDLLQRASAAARRPDALAALAEWERAEGVQRAGGG